MEPGRLDGAARAHPYANWLDTRSILSIYNASGYLGHWLVDDCPGFYLQASALGRGYVWRIDGIGPQFIRFYSFPGPWIVFVAMENPARAKRDRAFCKSQVLRGLSFDSLDRRYGIGFCLWADHEKANGHKERAQSKNRAWAVRRVYRAPRVQFLWRSIALVYAIQLFNDHYFIFKVYEIPTIALLSPDDAGPRAVRPQPIGYAPRICLAPHSFRLWRRATFLLCIALNYYAMDRIADRILYGGRSFVYAAAQGLDGLGHASAVGSLYRMDMRGVFALSALQKIRRPQKKPQGMVLELFMKLHWIAYQL